MGRLNRDVPQNSDLSSAAYVCEKRILILVDSPGGGGAERVACRLADGFARRHQVYLIYCHDRHRPYTLSPAVRLIDASRPEMPPSRSRCLMFLRAVALRLRLIRTVRRIQVKNAIDVTISLLPDPNLLNALSSSKCRRILSERNDPSQNRPSYRWMAKFCFSRADHVVFQTEKVRGMFPARVRAKSSVIPNPTSVSCFAATDSAPKIVAVGRLASQKNHAMLLRAFARFLTKHPGYTLHLYGEGPLEEHLRALAYELGLADSVVFEGFCSNVHQKIRDAEMFVLTSDYEGQPNALMEAMRMGLPCISTACTGAEELIRDGENGLLVEIGDEEGLACAMDRLSENILLRHSLGNQAKTDMERYSPETIIALWEKLLY